MKFLKDSFPCKLVYELTIALTSRNFQFHVHISFCVYSGLPAETNIIEEETEIPEVETDPNKFHVHVEGLPAGCSSVGGAQEWEGELNVEEVKCPTGRKACMQDKYENHKIHLSLKTAVN